MDLQQVEGFQRSLNHPEAAMVRAISAGQVLSTPAHIAMAEQNLKNLREQLIPGVEEKYRSEEFYYTNYDQTQAAIDTKAKIAQYKQWIRIIETAIKQGRKAIEAKEKEARQKHITHTIDRAKSLQKKLELDGNIMQCINKLYALTGGKYLSKFVDPVMRNRTSYKSVLEELKKIEADGVKVPKFPPVPEDNLYGRVKQIQG